MRSSTVLLVLGFIAVLLSFGDLVVGNAELASIRSTAAIVFFVGSIIVGNQEKAAR